MSKSMPPGKYVLPGLIDAHAHTQDERGGIPQPLDYELKIWLSCGITTVRDVGSDMKKTLALRAQSAAGEVAAPRMLVYPMFNAQHPVPDERRTSAGARSRIQSHGRRRRQVHGRLSRRYGSG